jgi:hypothetical protein
MNRKKIAGIRVCCVSLMVNTTNRGTRKIQRLLPRFVSGMQNPVPPLIGAL